jgi:hypothetical protein
MYSGFSLLVNQIFERSGFFSLEIKTEIYTTRDDSESDFLEASDQV